MLEGKEKDLIRQRNETDETLQQLRSEIQTLREQTSQAKEEVDRTTRRASSVIFILIIGFRRSEKGFRT